MQIVDFIKDNWQFISSAILALLTIIAMVIKKKPSFVDPSAYSTIIDLINKAEDVFGEGHGDEKLRYVLAWYQEIKGISNRCLVKDIVTPIVENVLSTPQKKDK